MIDSIVDGVDQEPVDLVGIFARAFAIAFLNQSPAYFFSGMRSIGGVEIGKEGLPGLVILRVVVWAFVPKPCNRSVQFFQLFIQWSKEPLSLRQQLLSALQHLRK